MADVTITLRWPGRRRRAGVLLVLALAMAPVALASDRFGDVPNTNTFHGNINNIAAAGITSGCGGGNYCPKESVTREQMAAFLNRIGGHAAVDGFATPLGNTPGAQPVNGAVVASTTISTPGIQALYLQASFFTFTYAGSGTFPCEIAYRFKVDGILVGAAQMYDRFNAAPPNTWETRTISGQTLVIVEAGTTTVTLIYQRVTNACSSYPGNGMLIVETIPFTASGNAWAGAAAEPGDEPVGQRGTPTTQSNGDPIE
jgi:hypothetical protein